MDISIDGPGKVGEIDREVRYNGDHLLIKKLFELDAFPSASGDDAVEFIIE